MDTTSTLTSTSALFRQAGSSFAVVLLTMIFAVFHLPVDPWIRALLGSRSGPDDLVVHPRRARARLQENQTVYARLVQARDERILAEHDPSEAVS